MEKNEGQLLILRDKANKMEAKKREIKNIKAKHDIVKLSLTD